MTLIRITGLKQKRERRMYAKRADNWNDAKYNQDPQTNNEDQQTYKRVNKRLDYKAAVVFSMNARISTATVRNISKGGAAIQAADSPSIGEMLTISIPFAQKQKNVRRKAIVCWVSKDVFGVKFIPNNT